jgi:hypothetical protein
MPVLGRLEEIDGLRRSLVAEKTWIDQHGDLARRNVADIKFRHALTGLYLRVKVLIRRNHQRARETDKIIRSSDLLEDVGATRN